MVNFLKLIDEISIYNITFESFTKILYMRSVNLHLAFILGIIRSSCEIAEKEIDGINE